MSSKAGKRIFIACVLMTSVVIGLVFVRSSATEEMVGGSVVVLNYADVDFYPSVRSLDDKGQVTGSAGYPVGPRAGGGKAACCVSIPEHWRPGIRMAVRYRLGDWPEDRYEMFYAELKPYPEGIPDRVWVALLPDRTIEVMSSMFGPEDPAGRWPGRIKQFPR